MKKNIRFYLSIILALTSGCSYQKGNSDVLNINPMNVKGKNFAFLNKGCGPAGSSPYAEKLDGFRIESRKSYKSQYYWCIGVLELNESNVFILKSITPPKNVFKKCAFFWFDGAYRIENNLYMIGKEESDWNDMKKDWNKKEYFLCNYNKGIWLGKSLKKEELEKYFKIFPQDYKKRANIGFLKKLD